MFPFNSRRSSAQEEAVNNIYNLIEWLEAEKKGWKNYRPVVEIMGAKFPYHTDDKYTHNSYGSTDTITHKFEKLIKHVRKACVELCTVYISLLKRACHVAKKTGRGKPEKDLHEIYAVMASLYDNMLVSDLKKELKKEHRIEFMEALKLKRYVKESFKREMVWDVEGMHEHGVPEWDETDHDWIRVRQRVAKDMYNTAGKNWRENSIVKKVLSKEQQFTNDISEFLKRFKIIVDSLSQQATD